MPLLAKWSLAQRVVRRLEARVSKAALTLTEALGADLDAALASLREHVAAEVVIEFAARVVEASNNTAGTARRLRELDVVANLRFRGGRCPDAEMATRTVVGSKWR